MRSVTYIGVDGSVWPLTSMDHAGVFLQATSTDLAAEDDALSGSLDLVVADHTPDGAHIDELGEVEARWRRAWSHHVFGTLRVEDEQREDAWLRVKLAAPVPSFPEFGIDGYQEFEQSVVADSPVWWRSRVFHGGVVTVINSGDVDGWARVRWTQPGDLVMPSGAVLSLPPVEEPRTIVLDPHESCIVLDDAGEVDPELWRQLRGGVFPEIVPAGEQRVFTIPEGATLLFNEGVHSPW